MPKKGEKLPRVTCPECARLIPKRSIKHHQGGRPCRSQQVCNRMLKQHGLHSMPNLEWAKVLKWAGVPYERVPANYKSARRRPGAWRHKSGYLWRIPENEDYTAPVYKDLGDTLFCEQWVLVVLGTKHDSITMYPNTKLGARPLVEMLRRINQRNDEFKKMMMTTAALGGDQAFNLLLVSEGLWTLGS